MPQLNSDQLASVQNFINKLEDSLVKSQYEKWLAEVSPTGRATSEQMEYFVSRATHLPVEVQSFPQSFAASVKNTPENTKLASDSISGVSDTKKVSTAGKKVTDSKPKK